MGKKHFSRNLNISDDLICWSSQLDALGNTISALSCSNAGEECFHQDGEYLGMIISDYARAIHNTLEDIYCKLAETFEGYDGSKIQKLKSRIERLRKDGAPTLAMHVDEFDNISEEYTPIFDEVMELNSAVVNMEKELKSQIIEHQQKRALAKADTETKAQDIAEQKQPDSEITVTH